MVKFRATPRLSGFWKSVLHIVGEKIALLNGGSHRLCVLNYHRILDKYDPLSESDPDIETFQWQMELLSECFNVLPLYDAVVALQKGQLPPRSVCITFDDGYQSVHDLALPILTRLSLPATVFVSSGFVEKENMWNDRIVEAVRTLPVGELDVRDFGMGVHRITDAASRNTVASQLTYSSKYMHPVLRTDLAQKLEQLAGSVSGNDLMLTREMIRTLHGSGIEIGGHTISHPILTSVEDHVAREEIFGCKQQLEAIIGSTIRLFAYPNGKPGMDFDARHAVMAKEAGFCAAFTTAIGAASKSHDLFQLPRSRPWDKTPFTFGLRLLRWLAH